MLQQPSLRRALGASLVLLSMPLAAQEAARQGSNFNPRTSLILQGTFADYSSDLEPGVPGVLLGPETEPRPAGFSLSETELVMEANADDQFRGWAAIALENEDGETVVALEEAYLETTALPAGLSVKAGRFFSDLGYLNRVHGHAWDFVDAPLVYRALLAKQYKDDGVQLRWVAPTDLFFELGVEALRGQAYPGGGDDRSGANSFVGFAHLGGDIGVGGAWRLGFSHLRADADGRETGEEDGPATYAFTGDSAVSIVDLVFKWAENGNPQLQNVVFNAEFFQRDEDGTLDFDDGASSASSGYEGTQRGFYLQGVYQFAPRWRVGLRYDQLAPDNRISSPDTAFDELASDETATRTSAMLDFSNSEFSRIRLQYSRDESRGGGEADDQWFLQYILSLGSHPAHQF